MWLCAPTLYKGYGSLSIMLIDSIIVGTEEAEADHATRPVWLHEALTREQSEAKLKGSAVGTFLVRAAATSRFADSCYLFCFVCLSGGGGYSCIDR